LVTLVIFLAASGLQVVKDAVPHVNWHSCRHLIASGLLVLAGLAFLTAFGWIVWMVQNVLRPRGARHYRSPKAGVDLMWQDHVLAHGTNGAYADAVRGATTVLLLRNITDQIFEVASISKDKMDALVRARFAIWCAFVSWVIAVVSGLLLTRWK